MPIKVLVVDDSIVYRTKLQLSLSKNTDIKVVACASSAEEALKKISWYSPDVITLDIEMPNMDGLQFIQELLPEHPLPVIVVSSIKERSAEAIRLGAYDFVPKPDLSAAFTSEDFIAKLASVIRSAAKSLSSSGDAASAPVASIELSRTPEPSQAQAISSIASSNKIIAIGASTGGTEAIIQVVKNLPANSPPIVIVQHMPAKFTKLYADRLNTICKMRVKEAEDNDRVIPGQIIIGEGDKQLTLKKDSRGYYVRSVPGEKVSGHCPSVDVLFTSVSEIAGKNAIGVILTGMGADGARGITEMRKKGAFTIGQNKETCVVYGMPMEAFKLGGITKQLPLESIANSILNYLSKNV